MIFMVCNDKEYTHNDMKEAKKTSEQIKKVTCNSSHSPEGQIAYYATILTTLALSFLTGGLHIVKWNLKRLPDNDDGIISKLHRKYESSK